MTDEHKALIKALRREAANLRDRGICPLDARTIEDDAAAAIESLSELAERAAATLAECTAATLRVNELLAEQEEKVELIEAQLAKARPHTMTRDLVNLFLGLFIGQATVILAFKLGVISAKLFGG